MTHGNQHVRCGDFNRMVNLNAEVKRLVGEAIIEADYFASNTKRPEGKSIRTLIPGHGRVTRDPIWKDQHFKEGLQ